MTFRVFYTDAHHVPRFLFVEHGDARSWGILVFEIIRDYEKNQTGLKKAGIMEVSLPGENRPSALSSFGLTIKDDDVVIAFDKDLQVKEGTAWRPSPKDQIGFVYRKGALLRTGH